MPVKRRARKSPHVGRKARKPRKSKTGGKKMARKKKARALLAPSWFEHMARGHYGAPKKRRARRKTKAKGGRPVARRRRAAPRKKRRARRGQSAWTRGTWLASAGRNHVVYHPRKRKGRKHHPRRVPVVRVGKRREILVRNPKGIVGTVLHGFTDAAEILAGKVAVRKVSDQLVSHIKFLQPGATPDTMDTVKVVAVQCALAIGAGIVADKVAGRRSDLARMVTAGGFMAPLETLLKLTKVDFITSALAGDGIGAYPMTSLSAGNRRVALSSYPRLGAYPHRDTAAEPGYGMDY